MSAPAIDDTAAPKRFRPHMIPLVIGGGFALMTLGSFLAEKLWAEEWQEEYLDTHSTTREMFDNIPGAISFAFYVITIATILYGAIAFSARMRNWERGAPERSGHHPRQREEAPSECAPACTCRPCCAIPAAGIMHSFIYFSFLILLAITTIGEINLQLPVDRSSCTAAPTKRSPSSPISPASCCWSALLGDRASLRAAPVPHPHQVQARARHDPRRARWPSGSPASSPRFRIALEGMPEHEKLAFIGYPLAQLVENAGWLESGGTAPAWIVHVLSFIAFLVMLPTTMLRHMFTSPINMYLKRA
jgi:hypothetical protein